MPQRQKGKGGDVLIWGMSKSLAAVLAPWSKRGGLTIVYCPLNTHLGRVFAGRERVV